jgi:hypothetical protein
MILGTIWSVPELTFVGPQVFDEAKGDATPNQISSQVTFQTISHSIQESAEAPEDNC